MFKRIICLLTVFCLLGSQVALAAMQGYDITRHWGKPALSKFVQHEILLGDEYSIKFNPDKKMRLGETTYMFWRYIELRPDPTKTIHFADEASFGRFKEAITTVSSAGIFRAATEGQNFGPEQEIDRGRLVAWLVRATKKFNSSNQDYTSTFTDLSRNHKYYREIAFAQREGLLEGYEDGSVRPDQTLSLAEVATIIDRFATHFGMVRNGSVQQPPQQGTQQPPQQGQQPQFGQQQQGQGQFQINLNLNTQNNQNNQQQGNQQHGLKIVEFKPKEIRQGNAQAFIFQIKVAGSQNQRPEVFIVFQGKKFRPDTQFRLPGRGNYNFTAVAISGQQKDEMPCTIRLH